MKQVRGFTLMELMIAVAIVGILSMVALPSYQNHMRKVRRSDAFQALTNAAHLQERWYTQNNSYTGTIANVGGSTTEKGYYTIAVTNPSCTTAGISTCFVMTATAVAGGPQAGDTGCTSLTITQAGLKGPSTCW